MNRMAYYLSEFEVILAFEVLSRVLDGIVYREAVGCRPKMGPRLVIRRRLVVLLDILSVPIGLRKQEHLRYSPSSR